MSDKADDPALQMRALNARAATQRERFLMTLQALRDHANPARLKQRAGDRLLDRMLDGVARGRSAVISHPARTLGIAALGGAIVARGPLLALARKAWRAGKAFTSEKYHQYRMTKGAEETDE